MAWKRKQATGNGLFSIKEIEYVFNLGQHVNVICLGVLLAALTILCTLR